MNVIGRFIQDGDDYRERFGKYPPLDRQAVDALHQDVLVCGCFSGDPLVEDTQPMVNPSAEGLFYRCPSCGQQWLFVLSSRELVIAR